MPPTRHGASTPSPGRLRAGSPCTCWRQPPPGRRPAGPRAGERRAGSAGRSRRAGGAAAARSARRAPPPAGTDPASGRLRREVGRPSTPPRTSVARAIAPAPSGSRAADRRAVLDPVGPATPPARRPPLARPTNDCRPELGRLGAQRRRVVFGSHSARRRSMVGRGSSIPNSGFPATRKGLHASPTARTGGISVTPSVDCNTSAVLMNRRKFHDFCHTTAALRGSGEDESWRIIRALPRRADRGSACFWPPPPSCLRPRQPAPVRSAIRCRPPSTAIPRSGSSRPTGTPLTRSYVKLEPATTRLSMLVPRRVPSTPASAATGAGRRSATTMAIPIRCCAKRPS